MEVRINYQLLKDGNLMIHSLNYIGFYNILETYFVTEKEEEKKTLLMKFV